MAEGDLGHLSRLAMDASDGALLYVSQKFKRNWGIRHATLAANKLGAGDAYAMFVNKHLLIPDAFKAPSSMLATVKEDRLKRGKIMPEKAFNETAATLGDLGAAINSAAPYLPPPLNDMEVRPEGLTSRSHWGDRSLASYARPGFGATRRPRARTTSPPPSEPEHSPPRISVSKRSPPASLPNRSQRVAERPLDSGKQPSRISKLRGSMERPAAAHQDAAPLAVAAEGAAEDAGAAAAAAGGVDPVKPSRIGRLGRMQASLQQGRDEQQLEAQQQGEGGAQQLSWQQQKELVAGPAEAQDASAAAADRQDLSNIYSQMQSPHHAGVRSPALAVLRELACILQERQQSASAASQVLQQQSMQQQSMQQQEADAYFYGAQGHYYYPRSRRMFSMSPQQSSDLPTAYYYAEAATDGRWDANAAFQSSQWSMTQSQELHGVKYNRSRRLSARPLSAPATMYA